MMKVMPIGDHPLEHFFNKTGEGNLNATELALVEAAKRLNAQADTVDGLPDDVLQQKKSELRKLEETYNNIEIQFTERMFGTVINAILVAIMTGSTAFIEQLRDEHPEQVMAVGGTAVMAILLFGTAITRVRRILEREGVRKSAEALT